MTSRENPEAEFILWFLRFFQVRIAVGEVWLPSLSLGGSLGVSLPLWPSLAVILCWSPCPFSCCAHPPELALQTGESSLVPLTLIKRSPFKLQGEEPSGPFCSSHKPNYPSSHNWEMQHLSAMMVINHHFSLRDSGSPRTAAQREKKTPEDPWMRILIQSYCQVNEDLKIGL